MAAPPTVGRVRLAELVAMISLGTDLGWDSRWSFESQGSRQARRVGAAEQAHGPIELVGPIKVADVT